MKKFYLLIILLLLLGLHYSNAQSLAGYKFCINPGHGGHDSDDRYIAETGFWESEGNLTKGLYLKNYLESLGATVVMTRTQNRTEDDLPLSQIVAIANANNVDYFHAIHSNAYNRTSNYTLILFQGRTTAPTYPGSLTMANFMGPNISNANRTTRSMVAGDFDFYGTGQPYLGVFKGLNMPGTLSEGSFHDYYPESWRLKNDSYLKHEAWAMAKSFLQYYNAGSFANGNIAGIVRDLIEIVPASYYPIGNDYYKPINRIKVTLEPGGRVYNGDQFNNGFYLFDNVAPGNYKLIFEVAQMRPDTATVTAVANGSVFVDRLLTLNPILDPPQIVNYSPSDSVNEVSNISPIEIQFDIRMNATETQNAFSITPTVAGSFKWDTEFKKLTFTPTKGYLPGTKYIVNLSTAAKTHFGIYLQQAKTFSFRTRSQLKLVTTYPANGATDISTTVLMRLQFDKGIDGTTMANKITVTDSTGIPIPLQANISKYSEGIIDFEPKSPLSNNTNYTITVKEGIGDVEYVKFPATVTIQYKTEALYTFNGSIIEGFENDNVWQSPLLSPNTKEVNTSTTFFALYTSKKRSGNSSGRLVYNFTGNNGVVELPLLNPINLGQSSSAGFGIWIYGDNSKNILEYHFLRNGTTEKVKIDTLNWTGWKLKKILLNQITGTGDIQFKSINVVQTPNGNKLNTLIFDECTANIITDVAQNNTIPTMFVLEQNYPNPFNPTTVISYQLSANSNVILKVYDILGKEIATLVEETKTAGKYNVIFNGSNLASGIYIYRIQVRNTEQGNVFTDSKKLILIK